MRRIPPPLTLVDSKRNIVYDVIPTALVLDNDNNRHFYRCTVIPSISEELMDEYDMSGYSEIDCPTHEAYLSCDRHEFFVSIGPRRNFETPRQK